MNRFHPQGEQTAMLQNGKRLTVTRDSREVEKARCDFSGLWPRK